MLKRGPRMRTRNRGIIRDAFTFAALILNRQYASRAKEHTLQPYHGDLLYKERVFVMFRALVDRVLFI